MSSFERAVPIGVIKNISTIRRTLDLFIYDDALVLAKAPAAGAALRALGSWRATQAMDDRWIGREAAAGRDALLAADPGNRLITIDSIQTLAYRDHVSDKFEWKRSYNDHVAVRALLTSALGAKLRAD